MKFRSDPGAALRWPLRSPAPEPEDDPDVIEALHPLAAVDPAEGDPDPDPDPDPPRPVPPVGSNPKDRSGLAKPGVAYVPPVALLGLGIAMRSGAEKYGPFNWRQHPVRASVYFDAIMRHLLAFHAGETRDPDSGAHPLDHVMACCAILRDAAEHGALVNDFPAPTADVLRRFLDRYTRQEGSE